jgi:hypothetical protein
LISRYPFALALVIAALSVLCSTAKGQFETRSSVPGAPTPSSVAVGDFNRDGILDFADADTSLQIFLGDGDGTFGLPINYLDNTGALYAAAADFNRDG